MAINLAPKSLDTDLSELMRDVSNGKAQLDNGANQYFLSNQNDLCIGETVQVPTGNGTASGIIIGLEWYTRSNAPQPVDDTPWLD